MKPANKTSRRKFLGNTAAIGAVGALGASQLLKSCSGGTSETGKIVLPEFMNQAPDGVPLKAGVIGCGGRGTGATLNFLDAGPNLSVVAVADLFQDRVDKFRTTLKEEKGIDLDDSQCFTGFDAYKRLLEIEEINYVIMATPPYFRPEQFQAAVEAQKNVFMEKPVTVDGPSTRRMIDLAKKADEKSLKVGVGLMVRHCLERKALLQRIEDGEIGDIIAMRGYRMSGRSCTCGPPPAGQSEVMFQVRNFHKFLWASGGMYSDFYIHQIDELSWMKGDWPISAHAVGGRHYRENFVDQNFDTYSVEYTYPDGTKLFYDGRAMTGCHNEFSSFVHGTKGSAVVSTAGHVPGRTRTYKGHNMTKENLLWQTERQPNPYQLEWNDLIDSIRNDTPYNEAERGAIASLVTSMGRMAAHTGRHITYDEILNCDHEFAPDADKLTEDGPAPVTFANGKYPWPTPGIITDREY